MNLRLKPVTREMVEAWPDAPREHSLRGFGVMRGEELKGVIGIYRENGYEVLFSTVDPEVWPTEHQDIRLLRFIAQALHRTLALHNPKRRLYSYADPLRPGSDVLLEHIGFTPLWQGVYQWQSPSHS